METSEPKRKHCHDLKGPKEEETQDVSTRGSCHAPASVWVEHKQRS